MLRSPSPTSSPPGALAAPDRPGANERITLGSIGVGGMGNGHLGRGLKFRDMGQAEVAAVCDVDATRLANAVKRCKDAGVNADGYADYRRLLERGDIDAVVIATPDHWHAVQTVHACETGKTRVRGKAVVRDRTRRPGHGGRGAQA